MTGLFVMIDGMEGSGKGTVIKAITSLYEDVFDLAMYSKEAKEFPPLSAVREKVVISVEPTYAAVGYAIRQELLRSDYKYAALTQAHVFALDREILYNQLLIPLKKMGKTIIQERGIVSSLVYQPVQHGTLSLRDIMHIQGNKIAIQNAPDFLIIVKADPDRIAERKNLENLFFLRKIAERFESDWLKNVFERFGTTVVYLDANCSLHQLEERAKQVYKEYVLQGQTKLKG